MQHQKKPQFEGPYESNIETLCRLAKKYQWYREGERDEVTGLPFGITPYAIMAKYLWRFQQDGIRPLDLKVNVIPDIEQVTRAFYENYELKPGSERSKDPKDFLSDYILKK